MIKRFVVVIVLSLLLFGGLFGWKFFQINKMIKNMPVPPPAVVAAATVQQEDWQVNLSAVGSLVAVAGIEVSSEVAGKVKAIHFDSDQPAKAGQLLVELDAENDVAELAGLEANRRLAQIKYHRSQELIGKNFISKSDFDSNKAQLEESAATVIAKQAVIDKKRIVASFSGQLGMRKVNLGQYLSPGDPVTSLQKLNPIYVDFTLPEEHLAEIKINQELSIRVQAYPEKSFVGRISAINSGIDEKTRSVKIRATLENKEQVLRPGMFAEIKILLNQNRFVLTVPDTAITYNPYGNSVYIIEPSGKGNTVKLTQIVTGETRQGRVEIIKGLQGNERVVSAGQVKLRNGVAVTVDNNPAPGERKPAS